MKWNNVVAGVGILCLVVGLSIGMFFPRNLVSDLPFNYLILFYILFGATIGIVLIADGLKK